MTLWYLYVRHRDYPISRMATDGHIDLIRWLLRNKVVDGATAVIDHFSLPQEERAVTPEGLVMLRRKGLDGVCPQPGDVVWVRGAWKPWIPWIEECVAKKIWLIFYDANTGHRGWPFWNVILSDLVDERVESRGSNRGFQDSPHLALYQQKRPILPYPKPISEVFQPEPCEKRYDVVMGGAHIYDRKGQFRIFDAVVEYEKIYGVKLRCALPGGFYNREPNTERMRKTLPQYPHIDYMVHMPRHALAHLFNSCRLYVDMAIGGYGNRGPIEAGMSGCPLVIGFPKNHASYAYSNPRVSAVPEDPRDSVSVAKTIHDMLEVCDERREETRQHFEKHVSIDTCSGPLLKRILDFMRACPQADRARALEAL